MPCGLSSIWKPFDKVFDEAAETGAAIVGIVPVDTVKQVSRATGRARIRATLSREKLVLAQTPQVFRFDLLRRAFEAARHDGFTGTDEASLVERLEGRSERGAGQRPQHQDHQARRYGPSAPVLPRGDGGPGSRSGRGSRPLSEVRTGLGWDIHRLAAGRPLILGGVAIPSEFGLDGHSDADVLSHAITDAILGAASLGDIGMHFPDSDAQWKDCDSLVFLRHAQELAAQKGYSIVNVDSTIVLERPRLKDFRDAIRDRWPPNWRWTATESRSSSRPPRS